jgi:hypothetical protein
MRRKERITRKIDGPLILLTVIFAVVSLVNLPGHTDASKNSAETEEKKIVARVNGQPIYEEALNPYVEKELRKFKKYSGKKDTSKLVKRVQ